ncbi:proteasome inhibitor PI31 family protein [Aspergillus tanneri]|uniref:Uncharacterized protein n=1 Tax=Aspergillus tanneri TaxID=1220188 RepID=A0A5M9N1W2_9EURO|nr:uncharacterized protein ATNIH1004_003650 [Aspergillus tanneri]KAA8650959.1 hypothetical protein ATNIH1004_003650 [Aspergillus tanneri]
MATNTDALRPDNVLALADHALRGDETTEFSLKSPYEAIALIGHASSSSDNPSLPSEWNVNDTISFRYAHPRSSMQYLLKINRLGSNAVILALALGDDKPTSFDVTANDFISPSSLPISSSADLPPARLSEVFISPSRLNDLIALFKINVIQKLAPGVYKEGYEVSSQTTRESRERPLPRNPLRDDPIPRPSRPYPLYDPLAAEPRRPVPPGDFAPPGFEDEFEIQRPPRGYPPGWGGRNPLNIGDRDLYPPGLGPHDPLRGGIGPGLAPGGGGMHPTFDDPLFGGDRSNSGYDPQIPPGARYDPVGPGDAPFGPGRRPFGGGGAGGRGAGGGFGGFGGDII